MAVQACVFNLWKLHTDVCLHALAISVGRSPGTFSKLGEKSAHERKKYSDRKVTSSSTLDLILIA